MVRYIIVAVCGLASAAGGLAALPPPTPEQQAAAALNAAKAAHANKVDAYTLCVSQTKVADAYVKEQKAQGKVVTPEATPACVNPGAFVPPAETPAAAAAPAQPAAATAQSAAAPAQAAAPAAKK
ncbi:MAG TPA: hypothetical protein VJ501_15100 [Burkholderiaceae bacterium]|nr:hypothetical protein [Burkholderiaceae bacterium]